ncbi:pyridoxamine 5'-phosphate oxidase family protein [Phenylobacterium sp.]|uniref:pyridoxamine 5'-phosphate oxidase family protein n=1 Tax=Phenylobacterium sp. TaxID=1871053 RepID=UPI002C673196|nr:pyridoxamine 5'-phosphate oxidase family protein [Phenylobacterium sp.]HLZ75574.1 pyridoxamine 5'-phosphate oxidase family protein [Phenylobacterium sp.]
MANSGHGGDATQQQLWDAIEGRRVGMLELTRSGLHAQPMLAFVERRKNRLWFVARRDTDLVRSIGEGGCSAFVFQDGDLMASVAGALRVVEDRRRMGRYWNATVTAWLPEGLHDPNLTMLCMDCVDAEVWMSGVGLTKFSWELAWPGARPQGLDIGVPRHATLH